MIEFRKSLNLAASQLENHLDYALEEFGQKCVRPVPWFTLTAITTTSCMGVGPIAL